MNTQSDEILAEVEQLLKKIACIKKTVDKTLQAIPSKEVPKMAENEAKRDESDTLGHSEL